MSSDTLELPTIAPKNELTLEIPPRRRVSIADPTPEYSGRLSPAVQGFNFTRKISSHSEADGPVRRKSILHNSQNNYVNQAYHPSEDDNIKQGNGDLSHEKYFRSVSRSTSVYSVKSKMSAEEEDRSWWFMFCTKCRQKEATGPSWEPKHWQKVCPHPFCPTYRQFARLLSLSLIVLLIWGVVYCIAGETAAPGGQLFGLAFLTICAHFGGWLAALVRLPSLIGMLVVGILFKNVGLVNIDEDYTELTSILREIALVIILTRAGLDLDMGTMRRLMWVVLRLGLVPWIVEFLVIIITTHFILGLPWVWGALLGSIVAAVSPAVVVPCLFRLRGKGYGVAKGIPTLIIAVSGIDDAASVAIFGIIHGLMFQSESLAFNIIQGPLSIFIGIGFGILWGMLCRVLPEKQDPFMIPLRILMLFGGGLISVFGSEKIGLSGAGPLGCITGAFVSCFVWSKDGWEVDHNPAATAFEIFWMIFEPILFGLTGTMIVLNKLEPDLVGLALACVITGVVIRIIATVGVGVGAGLNMKEKVFVALSWMAKATVQAALGPKSLSSVGDDKEDRVYAEQVLMVCVLSILLTAPLGAVIITLTGPRLLTKTKPLSETAEWRRRSHRPSMRDISIIDEEEELDNSECGSQKDEKDVSYQIENEEKKKEDSKPIDSNDNKANVT